MNKYRTSNTFDILLSLVTISTNKMLLQECCGNWNYTWGARIPSTTTKTTTQDCGIVRASHPFYTSLRSCWTKTFIVWAWSGSCKSVMKVTHSIKYCTLHTLCVLPCSPLFSFFFSVLSDKSSLQSLSAELFSLQSAESRVDRGAKSTQSPDCLLTLCWPNKSGHIGIYIAQSI